VREKEKMMMAIETPKSIGLFLDDQKRERERASLVQAPRAKLNGIKAN
jgi:hypothetical protein